MTATEAFQDKISDYEDTVHVILGFVNLYRFDDDARTLRTDVQVFQGRALTPLAGDGGAGNAESCADVTPDLGVVYPPALGVLGEVKKSFPRDSTHWSDDFDQLESYDRELTGWPTPDDRVERHDIVLLVHQSRANRVVNYYTDQRQKGRFRFGRLFAIISFNRSYERQEYLFFEKRHGTLSESTIDQRLADGVSVPMSLFADWYSTVKLYDSEPPLPYMMHLIWEHVVFDRAREQPAFRTLRWNQKLEISLRISDIADELRKGFSFTGLSPDDNRQPGVPHKNWCVRGCHGLVNAGMAEWVSLDSEIKIYFRKYKNNLDAMLQACAGTAPPDKDQPPLFQDGCPNENTGDTA